jgi:hypothetical protein
VGARGRRPLWSPLCESRGGGAGPGPVALLWRTRPGTPTAGDWPSRSAGPVLATTPETHGPCSGPPVAKSLVYGPGPGSSWGDQASSPTRFDTYSHGSTHLGTARPGPGFFLSFGSLKPGRWDLGPGLVRTQYSGLSK